MHYIDRNLDRILSIQAQNKISLFQANAEIPIKKGFRTTEQGNRTLSKRNQWQLASDHGAFHQVGIPFIYFGVGTHKNYHTVNDTFENANLAFFYAATNAIYQQIRIIDQSM